MLLWGGTVISWGILMSQEVTEDLGLLTPRIPTLIISLTTSMSVGLWWTLHLKLWAQQFSQSCIILEVDSTGTLLDFDCYNQPQPSWDERSENPVRSYFSENIKQKNCAMLFISVSCFHISLFLVSFITWYNQDLYAKRKGYKRMLFLLTLKVKEVNPKSSAGRKPCFYFHWKFLKAR